MSNEEPQDELAPNVSPPARSNRIVFAALTIFFVAAVGLFAAFVTSQLINSSPVVYQLRPTIITTQEPVTGETIELSARWCNKTDELIEMVVAITWKRIDSASIRIASAGLVERIEPGCHSYLLIADLPEQVRQGTWTRLGAATYEHNGQTEVVHYQTEDFTVARR